MPKSFHISMPDPRGEFVQAEIARGHFRGASEQLRSLAAEKLLRQSGPELEAELLRRLDRHESEGVTPTAEALWNRL